MHSRSVLVVEDDLFLAANIVHMLAPLQVDTTIAGTKRDALERASERAFDVTILDLYLPDGNGIELVPALKSQCPESQLILVTGRASVASAAEAIRTGAADYLVKPFTRAQLVESVGTALTRKELRHHELRDERIAAVCALATGLAHHLRNPLNAALLQLACARRQGTAALEPLERADGELRRLARILRNFEACLDARAPRQEQLTSIDELWSSVVTQLQVPPGIEVTAEIEPQLQANVELERFRLALVHLARNAIEAMDGTGTLAFRARQTELGIELAVEDTGPGIDDPHLVFDAFHTTKAYGTGLGLTIVYRTVMEHGGTIRVDSRPGRTVFRIELPARFATS